ncbi:hypothetical protein K438DRAFT_1763782 [Mycena galopus ATCC 62051]|nr:hypothetical protein K438DRAFT_1763782 [Mycena galopus ATCC 62051]
MRLLAAQLLLMRFFSFFAPVVPGGAINGSGDVERGRIEKKIQIYSGAGSRTWACNLQQLRYNPRNTAVHPAPHPKYGSAVMYTVLLVWDDMLAPAFISVEPPRCLRMRPTAGKKAGRQIRIWAPGVEPGPATCIVYWFGLREIAALCAPHPIPRLRFWVSYDSEYLVSAPISTRSHLQNKTLAI